MSCEDVQDCVGAALSNLLIGDCLIYDDVANAMTLQICAEPNGLECVPVGGPGCATGGLAVFPSSDPNNSLTIGTDGRIFTPPFSVAAGACLQPITQAGTPADPFIIAPLIAPEQNGLECIPGTGLAVIPSSDPNNALVFGTDNRLFVDNCFNVLPSQIVVGQNGACFESTGDGCTVPYTIITRLSDDPCQGICCRADGLFVFSNPTSVPGLTTIFNQPHFAVGPFNGNFNETVIIGPTCVNVTNPSSCKTLVLTVGVHGQINMQKTAGNFVLHFETSLTGPGGPWTTGVSIAQLDPDPPTPQPTHGRSSLDGFQRQLVELAPGASQQFCARMTLDGFFLINGQIFDSSALSFVTGIWGQSVNTCP